ncbi:MAG: rRNA maturation RNase YbeY [Geminicoccaceae bacterium]
MDSDGPSSSAKVFIEAPAWRAALDDPEGLCLRAVRAALRRAAPPGWAAAEVGVLLTHDAAVRALNALHRGQDRPTNVLSFPVLDLDPLDLPPQPRSEPTLLGDVVVAAETVRAEALAECRPLADHVSHLVVHGTLHLLGHDHQDDQQAEPMERLERQILADLGVPDPYARAAGTHEAVP